MFYHTNSHCSIGDMLLLFSVAVLALALVVGIGGTCQSAATLLAFCSRLAVEEGGS